MAQENQIIFRINRRETKRISLCHQKLKGLAPSPRQKFPFLFISWGCAGLKVPLSNWKNPFGRKIVIKALEGVQNKTDTAQSSFFKGIRQSLLRYWARLPCFIILFPLLGQTSVRAQVLYLSRFPNAGWKVFKITMRNPWVLIFCLLLFILFQLV